MGWFNLIDRITGNTVAAADVNTLSENIRVLGGNGTSAPSSDIETLAGGLLNPGDFTMSARLTAPTGYLYCDGSAYSRTTYSTLYAAITESKGAVTITEATPGVVTLSAHGLATGDRIELTTDGTLPTNLVVNTNYFVYYVGASTFQLATTLANAQAGTTIDTSGAVQSGTHTLRHVPYGISGSTNFLVPDMQAVVPKGVGNQTINGNAKTGPAGLGVLDEDAGQQLTGSFTNDSAGRRPLNATGNVLSGVFSEGANGNAAQSGTASTGAALDFDSANSPGSRTGTHTKDSSSGVYFYIKY